MTELTLEANEVNRISRALNSKSTLKNFKTRYALKRSLLFYNKEMEIIRDLLSDCEKSNAKKSDGEQLVYQQVPQYDPSTGREIMSSALVFDNEENYRKERSAIMDGMHKVQTFQLEFPTIKEAEEAFEGNTWLLDELVDSVVIIKEALDLFTKKTTKKD